MISIRSLKKVLGYALLYTYNLPFRTWVRGRPETFERYSCGRLSLGTLPRYCTRLKKWRKGKYNEGDEYLWRRSQLLREGVPHVRPVGASEKRERRGEVYNEWTSKREHSIMRRALRRECGKIFTPVLRHRCIIGFRLFYSIPCSYFTYCVIDNVIVDQCFWLTLPR